MMLHHIEEDGSKVFAMEGKIMVIPMKIPVLDTKGTRIGTIETTESIAAEIASIAAQPNCGKLLASPNIHATGGLVSVTLAFEPALPRSRPRLIWCPPGCEEAAMKLLEQVQ